MTHGAEKLQLGKREYSSATRTTFGKMEDILFRDAIVERSSNLRNGRNGISDMSEVQMALRF